MKFLMNLNSLNVKSIVWSPRGLLPAGMVGGAVRVAVVVALLARFVLIGALRLGGGALVG